MTWRNDAGLVGNAVVVTGAAGGIGGRGGESQSVVAGGDLSAAHDWGTVPEPGGAVGVQ